jgi:hypothetical protein
MAIRAPRKAVLAKSVLAIAVLLSLVLILRLAQAFFSRPDADLLSWDQAARAGEAVSLAKDLRSLKLGTFVVHVLSLNWWPPLHFMILTFFIVILGPAFPAVILPSLLAYLACAPALFYLYGNLEAENGRTRLFELALLFFFIITSPFLLSSATWAMLEIFGIPLTYLAFGTYFKATRDHDLFAMRLCGLLVFLLWLLKYSYGLFVTFILLAAEISRNRPFRFSAATERPRRPRLLRPWLFPIYGMLGWIVIVAVTGGFRLRGPGFTISATQVYNPMMYLYQYLLLLGLLAAARHWPRFKEKLRPGTAILLLWGALPTALFLALPDKIKAIVQNFEAGRAGSAEGFFARLLGYIRDVITDYSLNWMIGGLVLVLAFGVVMRRKKIPPGLGWQALFLALGFFFTAAGFGLHESRYVAVFVPVIWIMAAWSAGQFVRAFSTSVKTGLTVVMLVFALIFGALSPRLIQKAMRQPWAPWAHHGNEIRPVLVSLIQKTQNSRNVLFLGTADLKITALLIWKLRLAHFNTPDLGVDFRDPLAPEDKTFISREELDRGPWDTVVLVVNEESAQRKILAAWADILQNSTAYHRFKEDAFKDPMACRILFFKRIQDGGH